MKKKDKTTKNKELHYWINHIMVTVQRGYKRRVVWVKESDIYKWFEKYNLCDKLAKRLAVASCVVFFIADAKIIISLAKGEKIYNNDQVTLWDVIMEDIDVGIHVFYLIMSSFFVKSVWKAKSTLKKEFVRN